MDTSNGNVYLSDFGNRRIDVFDSSGAFLFAFGWSVNAATPEEKLQVCTAATGCQAGKTGTGPGQFGIFGGPGNITVDPSSHTIYVVDDQNSRVQKFDASGNFLLAFGKGVNTGTSGQADICTSAGPPTNVCGAGSGGSAAGQIDSPVGGSRIAIAPGGTLYVLGKVDRLQKFTSSGVFVSMLTLPPGALTSKNVNGFTVDSAGNFYAASATETGAVRKYDSAGNLLNTFNPSFNIAGLTVDATDNVFVADLVDGAWTIVGYNPSGAKIQVISPDSISSPVKDIYYQLASGDLFAVENNGLLQIDFPPPGPVIVASSVKADPISNVRATLKVTFNPQGKASTARFQYVDKASFDQAVSEGKDGFEGPDTQTTPETLPSPAGFDNQSTSATNACAVPTDASCLKPETTYYFRAIVKNVEGETFGDKVEFTTQPAHEIKATWISEVGTDTARLNVEVNPLGIQANGYFQYIAEGPDYQANGFANATSIPNPAQELNFGSGEAPVAKATQIFSLQPGTIYHYRFVVTDLFFAPVLSAPDTFATLAPPAPADSQCSNQPFRTGPSAALPDCRAYEMVTPLDKNNGDVLTRINFNGLPTNLDQSSVNGDGFAFTSYRAFADPQSAPYTNQYLANRTERGQPGEGWSSENVAPPRDGHFRNGELENEFQAFSPDLSRSWILQEGEPTLDPCAATGFNGLYRRESASGAYQALSCATPGRPVAQSNIYMPEFQGASADGSEALIRIDDKLTEDASSATNGSRPIYQVYLSTGAGQLRLVSVLPDGQASGVDSTGGTGLGDGQAVANHNRFNSLTNAISADGTRVFWSTGYDEGAIHSGPLYLRLNADRVPSSIKEGKCNQPTRACTIPVSGTVTPTPEHVFFQAANPQGTKALFTVTAGPLAGNLYRFDSEAKPPASELIAEGVMENILGASEDLSRVYFASTKASAQAQSEGAVSGKPNVYLDDEGTTSFVAILSSPGGSYQYPDTTSRFGTPTNKAPILRTARVSPDGQSLAFMSNSRELAESTAGYDNRDLANDQPDLEVYLYDAEANSGAGALRCVSCNPSGSRPRGRELVNGLDSSVGPFGAATIPLFQNQHFQPRYLSDDGNRVYFNSFESLVLRDTNGAQDVYQWAAPGSGSCTSQSSSYVTSSDGCLSLISSGQSPEDSKFLDATPSGSDVFFTTGEGLLVQDYGLIDVYDARVNGGFAPPPNPPAACEGEACQGPLEAPNDPTPSSSTFQGAGNVVEESVAKKKKNKAKKKKAKAKKAKQQAKDRQQRANVNRRNHR